MKLSTGKRTFPGRKQVWRVTEGGIARHDVMGLEDETRQDGRALLSRVMRQRRARAPRRCRLPKCSSAAATRVAQLPATVRALENGPPYAVRISDSARPDGAVGCRR